MINIAGTSYPLNFSLEAAEQIEDRYGDISKITGAFKGEKMSAVNKEAVWLLTLLISQGIAYQNF